MSILRGFTLVLATLAAVPLTAHLQSQTPAPTARIKIDVDRTIGEVDPLLFGNFAEHLGRMIYGGIYEEGSPLSDANGFRKDVLEAVRGLNVSILRWPGGNFCSGYNWTDGVGPKDQRPARLELAWNDVESNRFGTDEFLRYAAMINAEPYICVNLGLGTIDDARYWVEYTNGKQKTHWAEQRRKNGRDEPWNVKYWALGNEIDGPWQLGHKNAEEYSKFALEAAKAMRAVDPSIKLIASGSSNYGADWMAWNRTVLQTLRNQIDYIAIHTYINNRDNDLERYLGGWTQTIERYIQTTAAQIREVQTGPNPRPIYVAYDEWNVWYRTGNKREARGDLQLRGRAGDGHVLQRLLPPRQRRQNGEHRADGERDCADHDEQGGPVPAADVFPAGGVQPAARQHGGRLVGERANLQAAEPGRGVRVSRCVGDLQAVNPRAVRQRAEPQPRQGSADAHRESGGPSVRPRRRLGDESPGSEGDAHVWRRSKGQTSNQDSGRERAG